MPEIVTPKQVAPKQEERTERGRFGPGNAGGPGNPFARQTAAFRAALYRAVTPEAFERVAAALVAEAEAGNVSAIRLLFSYLLGKPPAAEGEEPPSTNGSNGQATSAMGDSPPSTNGAQPNPPGPPSLKGRGEEDKDTGCLSRPVLPPSLQGRGAGGVRSEPSTNGEAAVDGGQPKSGAPSTNGPVGAAPAAKKVAAPSPNGGATVDPGQPVPRPPSTNGSIGRTVWKGFLNQLRQQAGLPQRRGLA